MVRETILKSMDHAAPIIFMGLVALLPLHMVLKMQVQAPVTDSLVN